MTGRFEPIGEGPPLAYLPGLDGSAELLFMQEEELARSYRVIRVPWRADSDVEHADLVADVERALDRAGVSRATIVAESFGGTVALLFALERPERVERLVVLNSFPYFPNRALVEWGRLLAQAAPLAVVQAVRALVALPTLALEGVPAGAARRFVSSANGQPLAAYARRLELVERFDVRDRLAEIRAPSLFVAAELDRIVPCDASRLMAERVPGASLRILPGIGHASLLTPGISLAGLIDEWWAFRARRSTA